MSSDAKDARWGLAHHYAQSIGARYEDFTPGGWQRLLDHSQDSLDAHPQEWTRLWAKRFREQS